MGRSYELMSEDERNGDHYHGVPGDKDEFGLATLDVLSNVKVIGKRVTCMCENPEWTVKQELELMKYRNFMVHGSIEHKRRVYEERVATGLKRYDYEAVEAVGFKGIWYGPEPSVGYDNKVILYVHGGSYVSGHPLMHSRSFDIIMKILQDKGSTCRILSLDYSLSPAGHYPTPLHELEAAYDYLLNDHSISPTQIVLGGDEAGGALCLALCYQIRETHPLPAGMFLISPWVDSRHNDKFFQSPHHNYDLVSADSLCHGISCYLQGQENNSDTSPILGSPQGLPKLFVSVGGKELMHEDILAFTTRCAEVNGKHSITVDFDPTMTHSFTLLPEILGEPSFRSLRKLAMFLQNVFYQ